MFSCDNVITIPQYRNTCWFNAILMAIFYSQHSRKLLFHYFEEKKDKFSRIMNHIIKHNYIRDEEANKYFEFMGPENILKYINGDKTELFKRFRKNKNYGYYSDTFLPFFLRSLNKKFLDIIIYEDNCYANFYSTLPPFFTNIYKEDGKTLNIDFEKWSDIDSETTTDYIIINKLSPSDDTSLSLYREMFLEEYYNSERLEDINLKHFDIDINIDVHHFNNEIYYNGVRYVLDSVLLTNNNSFEIDSGHEIAGITCKNNRYVYNGWFRTTNDAGMPANFGSLLLPCELMKFDWDVNNDVKFCLDKKRCKLGNIHDKTQMCFSFNDNNYTTLIYVKDTSFSSLEDVNLPQLSSLTLPSLKSNTSDFSELEDEGNDEYIINRKRRKQKQEEYKKTAKKSNKLSFIKFKSNYYLNKDDLLTIVNPNQISIYDMKFDYLGISHIKELEYLLNINSYNNIKLNVNDDNNTLEYNDYTYRLSIEEQEDGMRLYELIDKTGEIKIQAQPTLKKVKEGCSIHTKDEFLKFKSLGIASSSYLQDIMKILNIRSEDYYNEDDRRIAEGMQSITGENNTSYIDCMLLAFFNNKNSTIEELFFKKQLKNKYEIAIQNEFKSYYKYKHYDKINLLKAIQEYYNDFISQNPEFPKIQWARGKYNFTDLIILLQMIFNFNKNKIKISLSYNEKYKIIAKKELTIKAIKITKLKSSSSLPLSLPLKAIIVRQKDKYECIHTNNYKKINNKIFNIVGYIHYE